MQADMLPGLSQQFSYPSEYCLLLPLQAQSQAAAGRRIHM